MALLKVILIVISLKYLQMAEWQSGHAADCNSVYIGSIPFSASKLILYDINFMCYYLPQFIMSNETENSR